MVLLCGLTLFAASAHGMIYMWKDSTGIAHYTNKEYNIPSRYRAKAKALYPEANDSRTIPNNSLSEQSIPDLQRPSLIDQQEKPAVRLKEETAVTAPLQKGVAPDALMKRGRRQRLHTGEE